MGWAQNGWAQNVARRAASAREAIRGSRKAKVALVAVVAIAVIAVAGSYLIDEPLRRQVERQMNARLTGYTVSIGHLSFHPIGLSLTLRDLVFVQQANPDPPVGRISRLYASVHWRALLFGRLVANFGLYRPVLYMNLEHFRKEAADPQPVTDKGWQEAFQAIYPLKINQFRIIDGEVTYVDQGPFAPLRVTHVNLVADNIRNIRSRDRAYPSPVYLTAVVFETGKVTMDGRADFLATPHPAIKADVSLDRIALDYFKPITNRYNVIVKKGRLTAKGLLEYAPTIKVADLETATIDGIEVEYVHTPAKAGVVQAATAETAKAARKVSNDPGLVLRARELKIVNATIGFVNQTTKPPYRAFISSSALTVKNFSNQQTDGAMVATLTGRFMGSGAASAAATFRPERNGPDFDVRLSLEQTDMRAMNDMLRAYGKFDVASGTFSVYSEVKVKDGHVDGYVKPLFSDLKVYDPAQDRDKSLGRKIYEKAVETASKILKNRPRKEVATVAHISGSVEDAKSHTGEVVVKLIQNAFFKAILPGFDQKVQGLAGGSRGPAS